VLAVFIATVPATITLPVVVFNVKVESVPAGDELIVAGSMAASNVACTSVPVTTFATPLQLLVLVGTPVARLRGLAIIIVGLVAFAPAVPATPGRTVVSTEAAGAAVVLLLLLPQPTAEASSSEAIIHFIGFIILLKFFMLFSLNLNLKTGTGDLLIACTFFGVSQ
jgi:hypothetical protein